MATVNLHDMPGAVTKLSWVPENQQMQLFVSVPFGLEHFQFTVIWDTNQKSANYHPKYFNRAARLLRKLRLAAPADVPELDRRLAARPQVIHDMARANTIHTVVIDGVEYQPR